MPKSKCKFPDEFFEHWTFPKQKKRSLEALGSGHKSDINQQRYTVSSKSTKECNITFFFLLNRNSYEAAPVMAAEAVMTPTLLTAISPSAQMTVSPYCCQKYFLIPTLKPILKCRHEISCNNKSVTTPLTLHTYMHGRRSQCFTFLQHSHRHKSSQ